MDWNDLRYVKAIADAGNVAEASTKLNLHQSTVFRRLNTLEKNLGVRLFERLPSGYVMTEAGEDFCQAAERIEADISALNRRISGQDMRPSGTIRVTMADALLVKLLAPCLAKFRLEYPRIELEVLISKDVLNLTKRDADIAVRTTTQPLETLVGRKVSSVAIAIYGSKEYLRIHPNLSELNQHDWVGFDESVIDSATARWLKHTVPDVKFHYRFNTCMGILAAVKENAGLALLSCYLGDSDPHLNRVSNPIPELEKELWILTHEDLRYVTRIRTFIDFVASFLGQKIELIEGLGDKITT
ncbi:Transcriptional regulator, LysR family [Hyella patelloides LEGE 07179]|uniref:Transcriptional regulator, LysR family n=1 Tax=Hyella patelloides LEGE 07179 TaxID=945734 RepID=A0A563VSR8_9CYAN|nr:LysR family transcriptional regulator [Hyella patelloides]VEP14516.1 Transcriptional regulator, LysR family [Hyella patelloides LEGE 07179]